MSEQEQNTNSGLDNQDLNNAGNESFTDEANDNVDETSDNNAEKETNTDDSGVYGAPENYDFKDVQLPEGFQIDEGIAKQFAPIGKELNLSQQSANKLAKLLVDIQQQQLADAPNKIAEFRKQEKEAVKLSYEKMLNTDKEINAGGDKAKMNAYLDVADKGYNAFADDELKGVFSDLHLNYHPAVIKFFHKLGKLTGNDTITKTNIPVGMKQDAADILYGSNGN